MTGYKLEVYNENKCIQIEYNQIGLTNIWVFGDMSTEDFAFAFAGKEDGCRVPSSYFCEGTICHYVTCIHVISLHTVHRL